MDRNSDGSGCLKLLAVALRKESVDRNDIRHATSTRPSVALRKESVDRNICPASRLRKLFLSLSARRAWIEIILVVVRFSDIMVALRKESVDRNGEGHNRDIGGTRKSLSARRAWIEISIDDLDPSITRVALRKESVDRNLTWHCIREDVS